MTSRRPKHFDSPSRLAACLLLATLLAGCATTPQVRSASAPGVDLAAFRTFSFYPDLSTNRAGFHTLVSQQLMFSTRRELEVRGFTFVDDPAEADLLVNFYVDLAQEFRVRSTPSHWHGPTYWQHRRGFYDPWRGHRRWPMHSTVEVQTLTDGILSVDLVDRSRNALVWEGVASRRVNERTLNDLGPALDDAVHRLFGQFPAPAIL